MNKYDGLEDHSFDESIVAPDGAVYSIRWGDDEPALEDAADAGDGGLALCSTPERRVAFLAQTGHLAVDDAGGLRVTRAGCDAAAEAIVDRLRGAA